MVMCVVMGCSKRSGRDKDVKFFRIPAVQQHKGQKEKELCKRRRDGYLAAISRERISFKILENDCICSRHFISGKPASLHDDTNPDWLPTLNLGHKKFKRESIDDSLHLKRYERCKRRRERKVIADSPNSIPTKHNLSVNSEQKDDFQSEGSFLQEGGQLLGVHMDVEVNVRSHAAVHVDNAW